MENKINILLADDHDIVLDGYESILSSVENFNIVAKANNGLEVLALMQQSKIDVILLDLNMPKMNGTETAIRLKADYPKTKILIMTMFNDIDHIKQMVELGVDGYILKNTDKATLSRAIESVYEGKTFYDAEVTKLILNNFKPTLEVENEEIKLSEREIEIIILIAKNASTLEIAEKLFLSPHTIKTHRKNINFKLGIHNPAELIQFARLRNLIS